MNLDDVLLHVVDIRRCDRSGFGLSSDTMLDRANDPKNGGYLATLNYQKAIPMGLRHIRLLPTLIWPIYRGVRHVCATDAS